MAFKIIQNLVPYNKYSIKCPFYMDPEFIVIHNTANDAPATGEINYMISNNNQTSFHYAVDDIQAVQGLPLDRNGWHASDGTYGEGNRKGIAIEICYSLSGGPKFEKAQDNAAELCAILLKDYNWGLNLNKIKKHEDFTNKHCPHRTLDDYGWDYFLNLVKEKYEKLYMEDEPMTKEEKREFDALVNKVTKLERENSDLKTRLDHYDKMGVYDNAAIKWAYIDKNLPDWAAPTVKKCVNKGYLKGNGNNSLELSYLFMRILVILDRAGLIK